MAGSAKREFYLHDALPSTPCSPRARLGTEPPPMHPHIRDTCAPWSRQPGGYPRPARARKSEVGAKRVPAKDSEHQDQRRQQCADEARNARSHQKCTVIVDCNHHTHRLNGEAGGRRYVLVHLQSVLAEFFFWRELFPLPPCPRNGDGAAAITEGLCAEGR